MYIFVFILFLNYLIYLHRIQFTNCILYYEIVFVVWPRIHGILAYICLIVLAFFILASTEVTLY